MIAIFGVCNWAYLTRVNWFLWITLYGRQIDTTAVVGTDVDDKRFISCIIVVLMYSTLF